MVSVHPSSRMVSKNKAPESSAFSPGFLFSLCLSLLAELSPLSVFLQVFLQLRPPPNPLPADGTRRVDVSPVSRDVRAGFKGFVADRTPAELLPRVCGRVTSQVRLVHKFPPAHRAAERLLPRVDHGVQVQAALEGEVSPAD